MTGSAIASAVTELERELGAQLVIRRPAHGVTLTPTGRLVLTRAVQLIADAAELQREVADSSGILRGPVAIGTYISLAADLLPDLLDQFGAEHPEVQVSFSDNTMDLLIDDLERGVIDCGIGYASGVPAGFPTCPLFSTRAHVVVPAGHPLADQQSVRLRDLATTPLILLDLAPNGQRTLDLLEAAGIRPRILHETWNFELAWSLVGRGMGYTVMLQRPRLRWNDGGTPLRAIPIEGAHAQEEVVAFWSPQLRLNRRAAALIDTAKRIWSVAP